MRRAEAEAFALSDREVLAGLLPYFKGGRLSLDGCHGSRRRRRVLHAVGAARSSEGKRLKARKKPEVFDEWRLSLADNFELQADLRLCHGVGEPPDHASVTATVPEELRTEGTGAIKAVRFAELVGRLLSSGILWRDFSRPEADLYDDAAQCEQLLREYFAATGFVLAHDARCQAAISGCIGEGGDGDDDGVKRLKARLSRDFVAAAIALQPLYRGTHRRTPVLVNEVLVVSLQARSGGRVLAGALIAFAECRSGLAARAPQAPHRGVDDGEGAGSMDMLLSVLRPVMSCQRRGPGRRLRWRVERLPCARRAQANGLRARRSSRTPLCRSLHLSWAKALPQWNPRKGGCCEDFRADHLAMGFAGEPRVGLL